MRQRPTIFEKFYEYAPDAVIVVDENGRIARVNLQTEAMFGQPRDSLLGQSIDVLLPERLRERHSAHRAGYMKRPKVRPMGTGLPLRAQRADGSEFPVDIMLSPIETDRGQVVLAVIRDITERKRMEEELRYSEERFRASLLRAPLPVMLFDDHEDILAVSQNWLDESGYLRDELRSIEDWTRRAHGERSGDALDYIRGIIATGAATTPKETMVRTRDGRLRLWSFVASALGAQSDGRRLFVFVAHDVTEHKAHEEQIRLLMHEATHRAKNMLSIVQAIAGQTAAHDPEQFLRCFTERLQALAASQDMLVRNEWRGADAEDLVRAQLAPFADLIGGRIAIGGPKLRLNAAAAQAIGLALHELATNAGKYGALTTGGGHVDVGWRVEGGRFAVSWTERDGPPVRPPDHEGFGTTVIDSMAKRTVDGEVELDYAPTGFVWRLTCPVANAVGS